MSNVTNPQFLCTLDTALCNGTLIDARCEDSKPTAYRLARTANGELVLQGCFCWRQGDMGGSEWRDLPTYELTAPANTR